MIRIYHNNRCSKSRAALEVVKQTGKEFTVINYLETPPTIEELESIIKLLNLQPTDLIRKSEALWKSDFKNQDYTADELILIMHKNPKLIERPIVIYNNKAAIGRPTELISALF